VGLVLGVAAARMLKASSADRYRGSLQQPDAGEFSSAPSPIGSAPGGHFTRESPAVHGDLTYPATRESRAAYRS
jgi:hypothetical protein